MKIKNLFKSKLMIFCIQILSLIVSLSISNYKLQIEFDPSASEQQFIIQFLANIILYNNSFGFVYINLTWIIVSLIPILIFSDYKKAYSMNLTTFFFPNFFFYVFLGRYSPTYSDANFSIFFGQTLLQGGVLVVYSISLSLLMKKIRKPQEEIKIKDLQPIADANRGKCPHCGTEFESVPKFCYKCSKEITVIESSDQL